MTTEFDKETHTYKIDGKPATGITTVISVLAKPKLIQWAANCAVDHLIKNGVLLDPAPGDTDLPHFKVNSALLMEARTAHTRKKEAAGTHGTDAHALVEAYITYCLRFEEGRAAYGPIGKNGEIEAFCAWAVNNVDHFLFAERQMFNRDLFIAGTADFGCVMKDGRKLIGDFKTSSGVYGIDYFLQCAGYKILAEGGGDTPYDGCVIVRQGKKGPEDFDVTYNHDTTTAEKSFMACLTLYRAQAALKETAIRE